MCFIGVSKSKCFINHATVIKKSFEASLALPAIENVSVAILEDG